MRYFITLNDTGRSNNKNKPIDPKEPMTRIRFTGINFYEFLHILTYGTEVLGLRVGPVMFDGDKAIARILLHIGENHEAHIEYIEQLKDYIELL